MGVAIVEHSIQHVAHIQQYLLHKWMLEYMVTFFIIKEVEAIGCGQNRFGFLSTQA